METQQKVLPSQNLILLQLKIERDDYRSISSTIQILLGDNGCRVDFLHKSNKPRLSLGKRGKGKGKKV